MNTSAWKDQLKVTKRKIKLMNERFLSYVRTRLIDNAELITVDETQDVAKMEECMRVINEFIETRRDCSICTSTQKNHLKLWHNSLEQSKSLEGACYNYAIKNFDQTMHVFLLTLKFDIFLTPKMILDHFVNHVWDELTQLYLKNNYIKWLQDLFLHGMVSKNEDDTVTFENRLFAPFAKIDSLLSSNAKQIQRVTREKDG